MSSVVDLGNLDLGNFDLTNLDLVILPIQQVLYLASCKRDVYISVYLSTYKGFLIHMLLMHMLFMHMLFTATLN